MPPTWHAWGLFALGLVQFAVGYWWWRGPYLEGTRGWVAGLFWLNGVSTVLTAATLFPQMDLLTIEAVQRSADRATNLFLLAIGLIAIDQGLSTRGKLFVGAVGGVMLVAAPFWLGGILEVIEAPAWSDHVMSSSFYLAVIVVGVAIARTARAPPAKNADIWLLCLAGIGFRLAELGTFRFVRQGANVTSASTALGLADALLNASMFPFMVAGLAMVLWERRRLKPDWTPGWYDLSLALLLGGFLFGFARLLSPTTAFAVFLSLALVRPVVFVVGQAQLDADAERRSQRSRQITTGGTALGASVLGVMVGTGLGLNPTGAILTGLTVAVVAIGAVRLILPEPPSGRAGGPPGDLQLDTLPLDLENVSLPEDWHAIAAQGYRAYSTLPADVRDSVDGLARWQRIVLALHGVQDDGPLPAYERTTPGLHLITHCPYASIGAEISRTNDRWQAILEQMGWEIEPVASADDEVLIRSQTGRAEGLSSPRAKAYHLTPLGHEIAEQLAHDLGLEELSPNELRESLGEGFGALDDG